MQTTFNVIPFWQEFGIIIGGTAVLFVLLLLAARRIQKKGEDHARKDPTH